MTRVASLSAHRNTLRRHRAKQMIRNLHHSVDAFQRSYGHDIAGYAVVAWNRDGDAKAFWDGSEGLGACPVSVFVQRTLERLTHLQDVESALLGPPKDTS